MVTLTESRYRDKVVGGWLGKLIGGAVGAPLDGQKQAHEVQLDPQSVIGGRDWKQSELSFQLCWLRALEMVGPKLASLDLVNAWLRHIRHADYASAHAAASFRRELPPPVSGAHDNPFRETLGAMARAELWGLVAPGDPEVAARYAHQDSVLDHAGSGAEAAVFVAAMVSAAFVEADPLRVLEAGLAFLPQESRAGRAARDVNRWHGELTDWRRTREMVLRAYGSEDVRDGVMAAGLLTLSLIDGRGDFDRAIATAARCGWTTRCTCGTTGAIMGVLLGVSGLPSAWLEAARMPRAQGPRDAKEGEPDFDSSPLTLASQATIHAGPGLVGLPPTTSLASLASRTCDLGHSVVRSECAGRVELVEDLGDAAPSRLSLGESESFLRRLAVGPYVTHQKRGDLTVYVDCDGRPTIGYDQVRRLTITLQNAGSRSMELTVRITAPAGFSADIPAPVGGASSAGPGTNEDASGSPAEEPSGGDRMALPEGGTVSFTATITAPRRQGRVECINPCTLFVSVEGGIEISVPITLVGDQLWYASGPYGEFDQGHPPEDGAILSGEAELGGEGWRPLSVAEPAVNLAAGMEGERGTYYLATDLLAPRPRRARLRVGCNDGTKVWCNGQEAWHQHEHRPADGRVSADEFPVDLRQGWNRLVIKMAQCSPRRFLSVVVKDGDGQILLEAVNTFPRSSTPP